MRTPRHTPNQSVQDALNAARAEKAIEAAVRAFSSDAVRMALARLLVALEGASAAFNESNVVEAKAVGPAKKGRRAPKATEHGGKTEALIRALTEKPRTPIPELTEKVYGDRTAPSQKKLRSLLAALKRADPPRADNPKPGEWVVLDA